MSAFNIGEHGENWDDDFDFRTSTSTSSRASVTRSPPRRPSSKPSSPPRSPPSRSQPSSPRRAKPSNSGWSSPPGPSTPSRPPRSSNPPPDPENWDDDFEDNAAPPTNGHSKRRTPRHPSSPPHPPARSPRSSNPPPEPEIWDDDYEDDGPSSSKRSVRNRTPRRPSDLHHATDSPSLKLAALAGASVENWDDAFRDSPIGKAQRMRATTSWGSASASDISDAEDRTVTARPRQLLPAASIVPPNRGSPPPPVPPLPASFSALSSPTSPVPIPSPLENFNLDHDPFPHTRSPTASVFSVPVSSIGRDSGQYGSEAHLNLRRTVSGSSSPFMPPPQRERERRRLKKKSRPPGEGHEMFELMEVPEPAVLRKKTRPNPRYENGYEEEEREGMPIPRPVTPDRNRARSPESTPASPSNRTPLLSRIGSVKNWGGRKKRASTAPSERERERPGSRLSQEYPDGEEVDVTPQPSRWFFRAGPGSPPAVDDHHGGAGEDGPLRRETSVGRLRSMMGMSPSTKKGRRKSGYGGHAKERTDETVDYGRSASRASSRMSGVSVEGTSDSHEMRQAYAGLPPVPPSPAPAHVRIATSRHASYSEEGRRGKMKSRERDGEGRKQKNRSASSKSLLVSGSEDGREREGSRFMERVRRISGVGRAQGHRSTKSLAQYPGDENHFPPPPHGRRTPDSIYALAGRQTPDPARARTPDRDPELLPPIELQPPSPPRRRPSAPAPDVETTPRLPASMSEPPPLGYGQGIDALVGRAVSKPPGSPTQYVSLGRSTPVGAVLKEEVGGSRAPRRNSLGDLKIPARISQAQQGLKRDLGMVREFAAGVEKLKDMQSAYHTLVQEIQTILSTPETPSRATSPTSGFRLGRRGRANTNPAPPGQNNTQLASAFSAVDGKYRIVWECAELLIELGGGPPASAQAASPPPPPLSSTSAPAEMATQMQALEDKKKGRERAITLSGEAAKPPVPAPDAWRASTGRHDLNPRQLSLLRDMLSHTNPNADPNSVPEEIAVNRSWRWGDAMGSTVTLPPEEEVAPLKKQRSSRLGMRGLRDMLKSLKRGVDQYQSSEASSSVDAHPNLPHDREHAQLTGRRRAKTSSGPDTGGSARLRSPYGTQTSLSGTGKSSPRRPSLASIFRIGQRGSKSAVTTEENVKGTNSASSGSVGHISTSSEEDWDRLDAASDLDFAGLPGHGTGTVKLRTKKTRPSVYTSMAPASSSSMNLPAPTASSSSIWDDSQGSVHTRTTRLSNVNELDEHDTRTPKNTKGKGAKARKEAPPSPTVLRSRGQEKSGSVRSAPPPSMMRMHSSPGTRIGVRPDGGIALAMTPENIKPLLENAREVQARLTECIAEVRGLLVARA